MVIGSGAWFGVLVLLRELRESSIRTWLDSGLDPFRQASPRHVPTDCNFVSSKLYQNRVFYFFVLLESLLSGFYSAERPRSAATVLGAEPAQQDL